MAKIIYLENRRLICSKNKIKLYRGNFIERCLVNKDMNM